MLNTMRDVAVTSVSRETKYFNDFIQYPKGKLFTFTKPRLCS